MKETTKRRRMPRKLLIPLAAALVLVMGIGVYAAYNFGLKDVVLPTEETTAAQVIAEVPTAEQGEEEQEAVPEYSVAEPSYIISLQGLKDSPEFQAMAEWIKFERGYDQDQAILDTVGNGPTEWDEKYNNNGYLVYSQEMADKMDEIVEKYDLKLHTGSRIPAEMDDLRAAFGDFTTAENWGGYYFGDGTISFDGEQELEGYGKVNFQFHRAMKGVFDTVSLGIEFIDDYEQWDYVTASGKQVLLALSEEGGLILLDDDDCFVTIHALTWDTDGQAIELSKAKLEALADTFDFSLL